MRHQVQREIEWSNSRNWSKWKAFLDAPASGRELLPIERQILSANSRRFFSSNGKRKNRAIDFRSRRLDRFSRLESNAARKFFTAIF